MNQLNITLLILSIIFINHVRAQTQSSSSQDAVSNFQPSLAVVIGILGLMFALTFILLIFAKVCHHRQLLPLSGDDPNNQLSTLMRSRSRFSGIDKTSIESLPFFRFSSLKGSKQGLECSICLSKFEDVEILRLLPKCKHAFHIDCIDHWLEKHSSCPICRNKVNIEDETTFAYSNSLRMLVSDESNIEIFVEREEEKENRHGSSRCSIGSSFRKIGKSSINDEELLIQKGSEEREECNHICRCRIGDTGNSNVFNHKCRCYRDFHKHNHQITISDVVFKHRWSNVSSSDLMFLNSEMINATSSNRFNNMESNFNDGAKYVKHDGEKRSVSEIIGVSRFREFDMKKKVFGDSSLVENDVKEERMRKLWFPIARRTAEWFVNRENRSQQKSFVDV